MLDELYSRRSLKTLERIRRCWLKRPIGDYLEKLFAKGYKRSSLKVFAHDLIWFADFVARQGDCEIAHLPIWIEPFLKQLPPRQNGDSTWRSAIKGFLDHLTQEGLVPDVSDVAAEGPHGQLIEEYLSYLGEHQGICREHVKNHRRFCDAFLAFLAEREILALASIRPKVIHDFITCEGIRYSRSTLSHRCSMLRIFLLYLYRRGILDRDLAQAVVSPRVYQQEQCPRFLTRVQIEAILAAIDRNTNCGKRDYAMILLLAVYGLRGIEVVRLCLDDIDWRGHRLRICRRKAGNTTTYPLASSVGEALLCYLKDTRPTSPHRQVFLSLKAPFRPVGWSSQLGISVRKYMARANVQVARPGAHTFRYSCAQRLFEQDMPLKLIGDYLGHRVIDSTHGYTKIALEQLRDVAMGDGEDLL
jgi:site-specific recombinase XerD